MKRIGKLRAGVLVAVASLAASVGVAVLSEGSAQALPPTPYSVDLHSGFGNAGPYNYGVVGGSFMNGYRGTSFSGSDEIQYSFNTTVDMDVDLVGFNHIGECIEVLEPFTAVNVPTGMSITGDNVCATQDGLPNLLQTEIFLENQQTLTLDPNGGTAAERVGLDELNVGDATTGQTGPPPPPPPVSTSISEGAQSGDYNNPTTVSATLTDSSGNPVSGEQLSFSLNGSETCSGTTNGSGVASCSITPGEAAGNYPLAVSFGGDSGANLLGSSQSATFTVNLAPTQLVYTGVTNAHYPETFTASALLTDTDQNTPVGGRSVTFSLAGGGSCTSTTAADGTVSCPITLTQAAAVYPITASFGGDAYYKSSSTSVPFTDILGFTQLVYTGAVTARYDDPFTASATLTDPDPLLPGGVQPVAGRAVTFTLGADSCTGTTAANGAVSCTIIVSEASGAWPASATYPITSTFVTDGYYKSASTTQTFTVTHQLDSLTYTGATEVANGYPATLSANFLETGILPSKPIVGRTIVFTLGDGTTAQSCSATTDASGNATCVIADVKQPDTPPGFTLPVLATFAADKYFVPATAGRSVDLLYYTGRSYAAAITPLLKFTPDTGQVTTAQWVDPHKSVLSLRAAGISVSVLSAEVKTGHKESIATAGILSATIALPKLPVIQIGAIQSASTSTCAGSVGGSTIASLRIGGVAYAVVGALPNSTIKVAGITIVLNQQIPIPGGLTVNAISITTPLGISVVLSSATSDIHNCT